MIWPIVARYVVVYAAGAMWATGHTFSALLWSIVAALFFVIDVKRLRAVSVNEEERA